MFNSRRSECRELWTVSQYNDPDNHYSKNVCFLHVGEDVHFRFLPKESKDNYNYVEFS